MTRPLLTLSLVLAACDAEPAARAAAIELSTPSADAATRAPPTSSRAANSDGSPRDLPPVSALDPAHTLILDYDDFGPQSLAHGLLGTQWYVWAPEAWGSLAIDDEADITVIVFRGIARDRLERIYAPVPRLVDVRLVEYGEAIEFLDAEIVDAVEPELVAMRSTLLGTRTRILAALGPP